MGFFHLGDPMTHELSVPFHTYLYDAMRETETKVSVCLVAFRVYVTICVYSDIDFYHFDPEDDKARERERDIFFLSFAPSANGNDTTLYQPKA